HLFLQRKRRCPRFVQNPDARSHNLDFASREVGIDCTWAAWCNLAFHGDHILGPHFLRTLVHRGLDIGVEDHLSNALAMAAIHKAPPAMIAPAVHPAHQHYGSALVGSTQGATTMGAAKVAQEVQSNGRFHIGCYQFAAARSLAAISSCVRLSCSPVAMFF